MATAATHKLIERIVNAIDGTITILSVTLDSGSDYICEVDGNTKWLGINRTYTIGADDYQIVDIIPNVQFTIRLTQGQTPPSAGTFTIDAPFFYHGSFVFHAEERSKVLNATDKTPFVFLNEQDTNDSYYPDELDARDRDSDCDLYFMTEANHTNWTNEQHYLLVIAGMENLIKSFIQAAKNISICGELANFGTQNRVKFGVYSQNGQTKQLFQEHLSGKRLNITIPFLKQACDFDVYTPPVQAGSIDLVINFNGTEYYNQTITEDTTINIVYT